MKKISDEEKSAAATLSDMEIFIFPELMYALVLANILSPRLWRWRELDWFAGIREMRPKKRLQRLRQHIMDNYTFNLDLETWGLTTQARELARFAPFLSPEEIASSNALFGYHGDAYYYDIDIRRHFGLDKYTSDVIPYWKTETVEAMDAFRRKPGHSVGAGECVSLAGLYAAAAFVVCGLPLDSIYLMATPLHSQNFLDVDTGILTNNRRLVTRAMWSNGTVISQQARRALEHERVTIVSHATGYIHLLYPEATISPSAYADFAAKLNAFLVPPQDAADQPARRPSRPRAGNGLRRNRRPAPRPSRHEPHRRSRPLRRPRTRRNRIRPLREGRPRTQPRIEGDIRCGGRPVRHFPHRRPRRRIHLRRPIPPRTARRGLELRHGRRAREMPPRRQHSRRHGNPHRKRHGGTHGRRTGCLRIPHRQASARHGLAASARQLLAQASHLVPPTRIVSAVECAVNSGAYMHWIVAMPPTNVPRCCTLYDVSRTNVPLLSRSM